MVRVEGNHAGPKARPLISLDSHRPVPGNYVGVGDHKLPIHDKPAALLDVLARFTSYLDGGVDDPAEHHRVEPGARRCTDVVGRFEIAEDLRETPLPRQCP